MKLIEKFPLGSTQYYRTFGINYPVRIVGHYVSDMGRKCVIAMSDEGIPVDGVKAGEAIVIDSIYIRTQ